VLACGVGGRQERGRRVRKLEQKSGGGAVDGGAKGDNNWSCSGTSSEDGVRRNGSYALCCINIHYGVAQGRSHGVSNAKAGWTLGKAQANISVQISEPYFGLHIRVQLLRSELYALS
jgi:hypothetical protein